MSFFHRLGSWDEFGRGMGGIKPKLPVDQTHKTTWGQTHPHTHTHTPMIWYVLGVKILMISI